MALQKITYTNKTNLFPFTTRSRQATAEDFNEIKTVINNNADEFISPSTDDFEVSGAPGSYVMKLKTRPNTNGQGYIVVRDDFDWGNIPADYEDSIWEIRDIQDVNGAEIVLPNNVVLRFNGGQIINATSITGSNTVIDAGPVQIFDADAYTSFLGTWRVDKVYPQWWGAVGDGIADDELAIYNAVNFGGLIYFIDGTYTFGDINLVKPNTHLYLSNNAVLQSTKSFATAIYVNAEGCIIEGGTLFMPPVFDALNVEWTYAAIYVLEANVKIRRITINNVQKVGIGFKNTNHCYVSDCIINGGFGTYGSVYNGGDITHYGIAFSSEGAGGIFVAKNNTINTCVQGVNYDNFGVAANGDGILITGNNITQCFKHGVNCDGGEGQIISNNTISYCGMAISTKCNSGASVLNNSILFGKVDEVLSNEVGILLIDPYNVICSGNNINGNSIAGTAAIALKNTDENTITDNIVTGNILKLAYGIASDAIQLGNASTTVLSNNIISGNIIESSCEAGHGAVYVNTGTSVCFNNIIENNNITLHVLADADSAICVAASVGGLTIRNNNIVIQGDAGSAIAVYGIKIASTAVYIGEVANNKISAFASQAGNINLTGVKVTTGTGALLIKGNKLDASLSDALTYEIVSSLNANAVLEKNIKDSRVPSSGVVTIDIESQTADLPAGNFEAEGSGLGIIKNILIRPVNTGSVAELQINYVFAAALNPAEPKIYLQSAATYSCVFAWEII